MRLPATEERFVLHWGEMGSCWGTNRTVAQIHALLFLVEDALPAEDIGQTLSVAPSNVNMRKLQSWGLVRVVNVLGDRCNHFTTFKDVWDIFRQVVEQRKRRELDPTTN
ncbi:MAG: GbsR/MarR family transcriptional regulator, partial [Woeseiales bacterium]